MALVLIGYSRCKLTQAAFEAQGHETWTCDLLPGEGRHLQMDVWEAIASRRWDFGIFHPMCTVLTTSGAWAFLDPDYERFPGVGYHQRVKPDTLTGEARRAKRVIELDNFRKLLALPFAHVIENPGTSFINTSIRPPDQIIHPHQFGDDASKATGLWRSNGVPKLVPPTHAQVKPRWVQGKQGVLPRWANQTDSGQNKLTPGADRWLERSATYPGIAAALGDQYGRWLTAKPGAEGVK